MSLLDIHVLGSPVLRQVTRPVDVVTDELRRLIDDMIETMYVAKGIGLAAPQVGRLERIAVIDVGDERGPFAIINPELLRAEGRAKAEEGCLSIPDVYADVERPASVTVRALDRAGVAFEISGEDLLARCLQHEIDHLHGRLFVDHLSLLRRRGVLAKWAKMREQYPDLRRKLPPDEIAAHHHRDEEL
ncbi:MAG TPA: peptide deformylase [Gemmatimonadaceae bacterium]|nr:peptide deformylase [Gemmatimonadaceae bacterium]